MNRSIPSLCKGARDQSLVVRICIVQPILTEATDVTFLGQGQYNLCRLQRDIDWTHSRLQEGTALSLARAAKIPPNTLDSVIIAMLDFYGG